MIIGQRIALRGAHGTAYGYRGLTVTQHHEDIGTYIAVFDSGFGFVEFTIRDGFAVIDSAWFHIETLDKPSEKGTLQS